MPERFNPQKPEHPDQKFDNTPFPKNIYEDEENLRHRIGRAVSVDAHHLGRELQEFNLSGITSNSLSGSDAFTEVYLTTSSGNLYCIYRPTDTNRIFIVDARSNFGKGNQMRGTEITEEEAVQLTVTVGQPLNYGHGHKTTSVEKILCVNGYREYDPNALQEITGGEANDLPKQFKSIVMRK